MVNYDIKKTDNLENDKVMEERKRITEILALYENRNGKPISKMELEMQIKKEISNDSEEAKHALEKYYKDAQKSTFLTREENDTFRFILKSVVEYFVARKIVDYIFNGNNNMILSISQERITPDAMNFINNIADLEWGISNIAFEEIKNSDLFPEDIIELLKHKKNMATGIFIMQLIFQEIMKINHM